MKFLKYIDQNKNIATLLFLSFRPSFLPSPQVALKKCFKIKPPQNPHSLISIKKLRARAKIRVFLILRPPVCKKCYVTPQRSNTWA